MLSEVHICPLSEVHFASRTLTSVLDNTPFISYLYSQHTPPPRIPLGKAERLSVYLYRVLASGLVLTVDDGENKCVGVAVWQGPVSKNGVLTRVRDWFVQGGFDVWDHLNSLYYGGGGLNQKVVGIGRRAADCREWRIMKKLRKGLDRRFWETGMKRILGICICLLFHRNVKARGLVKSWLNTLRILYVHVCETGG